MNNRRRLLTATHRNTSFKYRTAKNGLIHRIFNSRSFMTTRTMTSRPHGITRIITRVRRQGNGITRTTIRLGLGAFKVRIIKTSIRNTTVTRAHNPGTIIGRSRSFTGIINNVSRPRVLHHCRRSFRKFGRISTINSQIRTTGNVVISIYNKKRPSTLTGGHNNKRKITKKRRQSSKIATGLNNERITTNRATKNGLQRNTHRVCNVTRLRYGKNVTRGSGSHVKNNSIAITHEVLRMRTPTTINISHHCSTTNTRPLTIREKGIKLTLSIMSNRHKRNVTSRRHNTNNSRIMINNIN